MNNKFVYFGAFVVGMLACRSTEVPKEIIESIVVGEVTIPVKANVRLPEVAFPADILALKPAGDTSQTRMVAYGGSYFAGYRNGGLFREGQLTSVPELIAHQMQLKSFVSPLFGIEHGNGSGYYLFDKEAKLPSWRKVTNQTAIVSDSPLKLTPLIEEYVDNIACPGGPIATSNASTFIFAYPRQVEYFSYLERFFPRHGTTDNPFNFYVDSLNKKTHLVLKFDDMDLWTGMALHSKQLRINEMLHSGYFTAKRYFIEDNLAEGRKVVLFNIPDFLDFPFFHLFDPRKLSKEVAAGQALTDSSILIPNDRVKTLFAGGQNSQLQDEDVLSEQEVSGFKFIINTILNKNTTRAFADQYNLPLVDLHALFKEILAGNYYTDDGFPIDPSFPNGNFFSDDGMYPTAIGSAVIANETIKTINKFYKTKIPLVNVGELSKVIK